MSNTQITDRDKALAWWESLDNDQKHAHFLNYYGSNAYALARDIEKAQMWVFYERPNPLPAPAASVGKEGMKSKGGKKDTALEQAADHYVSNHEDIEVRRMYGHYYRTFLDGAAYQQPIIDDLVKALETAKEYIRIYGKPPLEDTGAHHILKLITDTLTKATTKP